METKNYWEVVVGNVGTIYRGTDGFLAIKEYNAYVRISKRGIGRASGEPVTLFKNEEVYREYGVK